MKIKQRNTAVETYHDIIDTLPDKRMVVYKALLEIQPACNLDIAYQLKMPINRITPRMNELVKLDIVCEDHRGLCARTNRRVIYWKVKSYEKPEQGNFLPSKKFYD